jgi:hypothetical protein
VTGRWEAPTLLGRGEAVEEVQHLAGCTAEAARAQVEQYLADLSAQTGVSVHGWSMDTSDVDRMVEGWAR